MPRVTAQNLKSRYESILGKIQTLRDYDDVVGVSECIYLVEMIKDHLKQEGIVSNDFYGELLSPEDGQYYYPTSESEIKFYVELLEDSYELINDRNHQKLEEFKSKYLQRNVYITEIIFGALVLPISIIGIGITLELPTVGVSTVLCILGSIGASAGLIGLFSGIHRLVNRVEKETRELVKVIEHPKVL